MLLFLRFMMKNAMAKLIIPIVPRATPIPIPTFAPVARPPEPDDDCVGVVVGEVTDAVLLDVVPAAADDEVLELELEVVEVGAKTYPFTCTANTAGLIAPIGIVVVVYCKLGDKVSKVKT